MSCRSQATTSAVIGGVGDLTCQCVFKTHESDGVDWRRCAMFSALGGLMVGPTLHHWYSWLHRSVPGDSIGAVGRRLLLDQGVFAPLFIPAFMGTLLSIEGLPRPLATVQVEWWPALTANWKLWVPAQLINFAVVPVHFQVLFANGVSVAWNVYLSWATHRGQCDVEPKR